MPVAALPIYDRPATAASHDRLWALVRDGLRDRGIDAPRALDRATPIREGWRAPSLLLGQICNLPYRLWYHRSDPTLVRLGCADHRLPGAAPGRYHSCIVTRPGADPAIAARRFALNEAHSHSGWGTAWAWAQASGIALTPLLVTGSHAEGLAAVADGRADMAAIDVISLAILSREWPEAAALTVIDHTAPSPGMTYITRHTEPEKVRSALADALAALAPADRDALCFHGLVTLPESAYDLPFPPDPEALAA